ncbi:general secretion pathway protein GspH [Vibrio metoecus]|nr:general secretion pathway protein GspH [Vibrio metoecus]
MLDADLVESVGSSAVSKPMKANKSRCFKAFGCSTRSTWFHKSSIVAEIALSLSEIR